MSEDTQLSKTPIDLKAIAKLLEEFGGTTNTEEQPKPKKELATRNLTLKKIITQLIETEASDELYPILANAYKLKKKIEQEVAVYNEEEKKELQKRLIQLNHNTKKLEREEKTLREHNKKLEEQHADLKEKVALMNAFREENQKKRKKRGKGSDSEEGSVSEEEVETFNADVYRNDDDRVERKSQHSKFTIHVQQIENGEETEKGRNSVSKPSGGGEEKISRPYTAGTSPKRNKKSPRSSVQPLDSKFRTNSKTLIKKEETDKTKLEKTEKTEKPEKGPGPEILLHDSGVESNTDQTERGVPISESELNPEKINKDSAEVQAIFDENTVADIVLGLEMTVNPERLKDWEEDTMLTPKDYNFSYQFKLYREGELLKFKDFAPKVFHQIRQFFGVSEVAYKNSFQLNNLKPVKGQGKSGAFFIFTNDKQFILKTATGEERDFLWRTLPYYWQYVQKNPQTFLPRFYGVYSMKHEGIGGVTRFVIMNNLFNTPFDLVEKYDLKGSTIGRYVSDKKRKPGSTLKDLDIVDYNRKLYLPPSERKEFIELLRKDTEFLATYKVMDYSLLLGIYYETPDNKEKTEAQKKKLEENKNVIPTLFQSKFQKYHNGLKVTTPEGGTEVYYVGIIDILIRYVAKKKMEHLIKAIAYSGDEVSVVNPKLYADRFFEFITGLLDNTDEDSQQGSESDKQ